MTDPTTQAAVERLTDTLIGSPEWVAAAQDALAYRAERIKDLEQNDRDYRDLIIHLRNTADSFRDDSGDVVASEVIVRIDRALSATTPAAPSLPAWISVPREPSRKLIEDLASEWAYDIEEASESYQGFLDVVTRHGMAGSDPDAYEREVPADVVALVKATERLQLQTLALLRGRPAREVEEALAEAGSALAPFADRVSPAVAEQTEGEG